MGHRRPKLSAAPDRTLLEAADDFLDSIYAVLAKDSNTVTVKSVILRGLVKCLGAERQVSTLTAGDLERVMVWIIKGADEKEAKERAWAGLPPRRGRTTKGSIAQAATVLRQFAEHCRRNRWVDSDVTIDFNNPIIKSRKLHMTEEQSEPKIYFTEEQWPELLDTAEQIHMRCRMAVALGLYCGRRASETVRLRWGNIDWVKEEIVFHIKKNGDRTVFPLFPEIREEFERWRIWAEANYGPVQSEWFLVPSRLSGAEIHGINTRARYIKNPALFPVCMTRQSSVQTVNEDTRKVLGPLGFPSGQGTGTHTWRRSGAIAVDDRYGLDCAQAFLGHKRQANTEVYTGNIKGSRILRKDLMVGGLGGPKAKPSTDRSSGNVIPFRRSA